MLPLGGLAEYEDALVKIADAEQELADGWREYEEGKAEAEQELLLPTAIRREDIL